jgi:hypothetical protein
MRYVWFVALLLLWPAVSACAAPAESPQGVPRPAASPAGQPPALNGISQAAAKAGVKSCLPTIEKVGNFVTANTRNRGFVFLPPKDADMQVTSASLEVELPNKSIAYASMSTAPTKDGSCDALYETVTYWDAPCPDVAAKGFPQAKLTGALQQQILVLQGGPQLRIFLMPAGAQGCVAIKKEVIY